MYKLLLTLGMLSILCCAETGLPVNLLKNGGFESGLTFKRIPKHWGSKSYQQSVIKNPFDKGFGKCLKIARAKIGYSIGAQIIDIDPSLGDTLVVSGYWSGEKIKIRQENWNGAKVQVIFYDRNDQEIGQPYDIAHSTEGFSWQMFIKNVIVPQNSAKAKVLVGLWDASGTVFFDELQVCLIKTNPNVILQNGDFESWGSWEFLGEGKTEIRQPGYNRKGQALYIRNTAPDWTFGTQTVPVSTGRTYKLQGLAKHNAISPGKLDWQKGRVYAEYLDDRLLVIGSPDALQYFTGTADWQRFNTVFTPPRNARFARLYFGLQHCTGEIAFDNLSVQ